MHAKSFDALYEGISQGRQPLAVAFNVTEGRVLPWDIIKKDPVRVQTYSMCVRACACVCVCGGVNVRQSTC